MIGGALRLFSDATIDNVAIRAALTTLFGPVTFSETYPLGNFNILEIDGGLNSEIVNIISPQNPLDEYEIAFKRDSQEPIRITMSANGYLILSATDPGNSTGEVTLFLYVGNLSDLEGDPNAFVATFRWDDVAWIRKLS